MYIYFQLPGITDTPGPATCPRIENVQNSSEILVSSGRSKSVTVKVVHLQVSHRCVVVFFGRIRYEKLNFLWSLKFGVELVKAVDQLENRRLTYYSNRKWNWKYGFWWVRCLPRMFFLGGITIYSWSVDQLENEHGSNRGKKRAFLTQLTDVFSVFVGFPERIQVPFQFRWRSRSRWRAVYSWRQFTEAHSMSRVVGMIFTHVIELEKKTFADYRHCWTKSDFLLYQTARYRVSSLFYVDYLFCLFCLATYLANEDDFLVCDWQVTL